MGPRLRVKPDELDRKKIIEMMVGRSMETEFPNRERSLEGFACVRETLKGEIKSRGFLLRCELAKF